MLTPKTTYSALEQIEQISKENSVDFVDKREFHKSKLKLLFDSINSFDKGALKSHQVYSNILITWKQKYI